MILDSTLNPVYLDQLVDIDRDVFNLEPDANSLEWAEQHPWMYGVLRRKDNVLGYTLVMPLRKPVFEALEQGKIWEDEIKASDVDTIDPAGFYFAAIAASEHVRNRFSMVTGTLVGVLAGQIMRASKPVLAVPITRAGDKVAKMINMNPIESELSVEGINGYNPRMFRKEPDSYSPLNIGN